MSLRGYQTKLDEDTAASWAAGHRNVVAVSPTGSGKTKLFAHKIANYNSPAVAIAHRQELVTQISMALANEGVPHKLIAPPKITKYCVAQQMKKLRRNFIDPRAPTAVAGIDTLNRRGKDLSGWANSVGLWVMDEAHHLLKSNKWGKGVDLFPNAYGLGVTATPTRADGKGLGRHAHGVFDDMVLGPPMRELINAGYMTDYRIFCPDSGVRAQLTDKDKGADGDYKRDSVSRATRNSQIIGDVVKHYLRIAPGKIGVTFVSSVDIAQDLAAQFNAAGVPAAAVWGDMDAGERTECIEKLERRELLQLVNVDLFGEGFDLPAIEVVSFARVTASYGLYVQQFGRVLRLFLPPEIMKMWEFYPPAQRLQIIAESTKAHGIIIDHVGNVIHHGLPDAFREWSLDAREARGGGPSDAIPLRACPKCTAAYKRVLIACPACGHVPEPANRGAPEFVDGDLFELDPAVLAQMRGEIEAMNRTPAEVMAEAQAKHMPLVGIRAAMSRHATNQTAQEVLRESIAWWAGWQRALGRPDRESYRRFYHQFGIDVLSAQALRATDADALNAAINKELPQL